MTQSQYDEQMIAIKREQREMHQRYDAKLHEYADLEADISKQILDLKKRIVDIHRERTKLAAERYHLDMEYKQRKSELAVNNPKSSMTPETV